MNSDIEQYKSTVAELFPPQFHDVIAAGQDGYYALP
jgi:hypothetical protein